MKRSLRLLISMTVEIHLTFNNLEVNTVNKVTVLAHLSKVYYNTKTGELSPAWGTDDCLPIDLSLKKRLEAIYKKASYELQHDACEECREEKLQKLTIELSQLVEEIRGEF